MDPKLLFAILIAMISFNCMPKKNSWVTFTRIPLAAHIAAIHDYVCTSRIGASIRCQIQIHAFELSRICISSHRSKIIPATTALVISITGGNCSKCTSQTYQASFISNGQSPEMGVSTYPGDTLFTRANPAHSTARLFAKCIVPALQAL